MSFDINDPSLYIDDPYIPVSSLHTYREYSLNDYQPQMSEPAVVVIEKKKRVAKKKPSTKKKSSRKTTTRSKRSRRQGPMPVYQGKRIVGYGSYFGDAGERLGQMAGGYLGRAGGDLLSSITGMGAYNVNQNSLLEGQLPAVYNKSNSGETVIRHREYLGDLISSPTANTFQCQGYAINAGLALTFPFLAQLAANFEEYRVEGMIFEFKSMSADALNSVNTALGTVIMATNYNSAAANFNTKAEMENYEYGSSCKPSCTMMHPIECARIQTPIDELYIRTGSVPTGQDQRLYDLGNFQIATAGFQGTSVNCGEIWITYQVALLKPKMYTSLGNFNGQYASSNATYTNGLPWGSGTVVLGYSNMTCTFAGVTASGALSTYNTGFYFPDSSIISTYLVTFQWSGLGAVAIDFPDLSAAGLQRTDPLGSMTAPAAGDTAKQACYTVVLRTTGVKGINRNAGGTQIGAINGPFLSVSSTGSTLPTTPVIFYISVEQIPNNVIPTSYFGPIP